MEHLFVPFMRAFGLIPSIEQEMVELVNDRNERLIVTMFYTKQAVVIVGEDEHIFLKLHIDHSLSGIRLFLQVRGVTDECVCESWEDMKYFMAQMRLKYSANIGMKTPLKLFTLLIMQLTAPETALERPFRIWKAPLKLQA